MLPKGPGIEFLRKHLLGCANWILRNSSFGPHAREFVAKLGDVERFGGE